MVESVHNYSYSQGAMITGLTLFIVAAETFISGINTIILVLSLSMKALPSGFFGYVFYL
jgi:hypothetical protein